MGGKSLMLRKGLSLVLIWGALGTTIWGCGGGGEGATVTLAEAGGIVKLKGSPLAGATITFLPANGPLAMGTTNLEGKFKLSSGAMPGVAIGPCKVTITAMIGGESSSSQPGLPQMDASRAPANDDEAKKRTEATNVMKKMQLSGTSAPAGPKSLIDRKYADPATSGLKETIDKDPSKNQFTYEVTE
jgi:hypothetical protein